MHRNTLLSTILKHVNIFFLISALLFATCLVSGAYRLSRNGSITQLIHLGPIQLSEISKRPIETNKDIYYKVNFTFKDGLSMYAITTLLAGTCSGLITYYVRQFYQRQIS